MTSRDTVYPTAAELAQAAAPTCTWCPHPACELVSVLDEHGYLTVPACVDCAWAHENEPSDQDAHDHYQDVCDRNAHLLLVRH